MHKRNGVLPAFPWISNHIQQKIIGLKLLGTHESENIFIKRHNDLLLSSISCQIKKKGS